MTLKFGTEIRTTCPVRCDGGFIPPCTNGEVLIAQGENAYRCEFANVEIRASNGRVELRTVTTTVLADSINEIPQIPVV